MAFDLNGHRSTSMMTINRTIVDVSTFAVRVVGLSATDARVFTGAIYLLLFSIQALVIHISRRFNNAAIQRPRY